MNVLTNPWLREAAPLLAILKEKGIMNQTLTTDTAPSSPAVPPRVGGTAFENWYLFTSGWYLFGTTLDAWAHNNIPQLETFFTPWHAILYAGALCTTGLLGFTVVRNRRRGVPWDCVLPPGYALAGWGGLLLPISGVLDALWHIFFGIEKNIDAAFSPTHLLAMIAGWLLVTAPFLAAASRRKPITTAGSEPVRFSLAFLYPFLYLVNITQSMNYALDAIPRTAVGGPDVLQLLMILKFFFQAFLFTSWTLYVLRRRGERFPHGLFLVAFSLCGCLLLVMHGDNPPALVIGYAALAGGIIEAFAWIVQPVPSNLFAVRLFAMACAAVPPGLFLLLLWSSGDLFWTIHLAAGSVVVLALLGLLLSYLILPDSSPLSPGEP